MTSMSTTQIKIGTWFDEGVEQGATHMLVVCDTFEHEDYPKYIMPGQDIHKESANLGEMQSLMEVYNLSMDRTTQLIAARVFNY